MFFFFTLKPEQTISEEKMLLTKKWHGSTLELPWMRIGLSHRSYFCNARCRIDCWNIYLLSLLYYCLISKCLYLSTLSFTFVYARLYSSLFIWQCIFWCSNLIFDIVFSDIATYCFAIIIRKHACFSENHRPSKYCVEILCYYSYYYVCYMLYVRINQYNWLQCTEFYWQEKQRKTLKKFRMVLTG